MPRRALALLCLAAAAGSVKLAAPQPGPGQPDSLPFPEPGELRTTDKIVFDTLEWRPNCSELYRYLEGGAAGASLVRGGDLPDKSVCARYERQPNSSAWGRAAQPPRKPVQFLHVSKTAGTFMCSCGNNNGQNAGLRHDANINCHYVSEDWPSWGTNVSDPNVPRHSRGHFAQKSPCGPLEAQYRGMGVTLEGNENYVGNGGRLCAQFETALIMRSPIHRVASHLAEISGKGVPMGAVATLRLDEIVRRWPRLSNNYFARSLSDASVFYAAHDALPKSLYEDARRVLAQFDHTFVAEREFAEELGHAFGWQCGSSVGRGSMKSGGTQSIVDSWKKAWPREDWQLLEEMNAVDTRLFREVQLRRFAERLRGFAAAAA